MNKTQAIATGAILIATIASVFTFRWVNTADERFAREKLANTLKDPSSVELRNLHRLNEKEICGDLNAKNSFGAYTGFKAFHIDANFSGQEPTVWIRDDDHPSVFDTIWAPRCRQSS